MRAVVGSCGLAVPIEMFAALWIDRLKDPQELSGDIERLASHDHNLLAIEQLLGYCARQPAEEVSLAIDDDLNRDVSGAGEMAAGAEPSG